MRSNLNNFSFVLTLGVGLTKAIELLDLEARLKNLYLLLCLYICQEASRVDVAVSIQASDDGKLRLLEFIIAKSYFRADS